MKNSISLRQIAENFKQYDGTLTVVAFDPESGKRAVTVTGLNPFDALREVSMLTARGRRDVRVYNNLPFNFSMFDTVREFDENSTEYLFNPGFWYGRNEKC